MLEDTRNSVVSGKWTEKSAGGCHLYDKAFEQKADKFTWTSNPKFHLKLDAPQQTRVKITLSRPEKVWKSSLRWRVNSIQSLHGRSLATLQNLTIKQTGTTPSPRS